MLKLNKKTEYAIIAVVYMSNKSNNELSSVREIAEKFSIPKELLSKVMHSLTKKNIIKSIQGANGGFFLEKSLDEITVQEIVEITHKPLEIVDCVNEKECNCQQRQDCNIKNGMMVLQFQLNHLLSSMTLDDLKNKNYQLK